MEFNPIDALRPDALHLIIMPTEKCNFRCTYCYEDFAIGKMRPALVEGVKNLISSRIETLSSLQIGWFGGEPTLAPEIVLSINRHVQSLRSDSMSFNSSMSTNGWRLDQKLFRTLTAADVRLYQISLDGMASHHDKSRITAGGKGTFDRIIENITAALQTDEQFKISLRLHISEDNCDSVSKLVDFLAQSFSHDDRISAYIKEIEPLGGDGDKDFRFLQNRNIAEQLRDRLKEVGMHEAEAQPTACYAALPTSLVIRADGRLAKCTVALNDERNTIGTLEENGEVTVDNEKFRPWIAGIFSGEPAALHCPLAVLPDFEPKSPEKALKNSAGI